MDSKNIDFYEIFDNIMLRWKKVRTLRVKKILILINCLFLALTCSLSAKTKVVPKIVTKEKEATIVLTLKEAIFLALRNNPSVKSIELDRINQKYALVIAKHTFEPNYTLTGSYSYSETTANGPTSYSYSTAFTPIVSIKNGYGTTFTTTMTNGIGRYYNPSLQFQVTQPLLQGFGKEVTEANLKNTYDQEEINKLTLKKNISSMINTIISDYFNWVGDEGLLKVDRATLVNYEKNVENDRLQLSLGKIAKNDVFQNEAQVAQKKLAIENDLNKILQDKLTLLKDMGLDADTPITLPEKFDYDNNVAVFKGEFLKGDNLPSLERCKELAFTNDPTYKSAEFSLRAARRNLTVAQDNMRWTLNLTGSETRGGGSGRGVNAGIESITNARNHAEQVGLGLTVPVDTVSLQGSLLTAKTNLQKAEINFRNVKRQLEIDILNKRNTVISSYQQLLLGQNSLELQRKTTEVAQIKHDYGKVSTFELIKNQESLNDQSIQFIAVEISYLNTIRNLNETLGITPDVWSVQLKDFDHAKVN